MRHYLIIGDRVALDVENTPVFPVLEAAAEVTLINEELVLTLMSNFDLSLDEAFSAMGIVSLPWTSLLEEDFEGVWVYDAFNRIFSDDIETDWFMDNPFNAPFFTENLENFYSLNPFNAPFFTENFENGGW